MSTTAMPSRYALATVGAYFTASNATDDTQLTAHAAPAISDTNTKSIIHIFNGGERFINLDFISLYSIVANASATRVFFDVYTDAKGSSCKTSGGTVATVVNNCLSNSNISTGAVLTAGAVVTAPATNIKKLGHAMVRPATGIALDQYHFSFGNGMTMSQGAFVQATVQSTFSCMPPVILAPLGNLMFVQISPSGATTAMTFDYQMGWWEL